VDGDGKQWQPTMISDQVRPRTLVSLADVDGDGDTDILSGTTHGYNIAWYENADGRGHFGLPRVISNASTYEVAMIVAMDMDSDGDMDVLSTTYNKIVWFENTDGLGAFGPPRLFSLDPTSGRAVRAADLDGDGDMDVLNVRGAYQGIAWYENRLVPGPQAGDANEDYQFDQQDLVKVLQAGKYLTGASATWQEGDWNGDGVFDEQDITAALETGNYRR
jgi:hypothetical protein